jgi:hypothetical protein
MQNEYLSKNNKPDVYKTIPNISKSCEVLFVHPRTEMLVPEILPLSLPALINRLPIKVTGRFYDEWTRTEVKRAKIIIMDVHWYLGLASAIKLANNFKKINPNISIVVGGLTASIFAKQLIRDSTIDYVVCGDAEIPLTQLVVALLEGLPVTSVPNLVGRDFASVTKYTLTSADLDENNFTDISFFPAYEKKILAYHQMYDTRAPVTIPVHPFLTVFRGCPLACPICAGSTELQPKLMGRSWVLRSASKVQADLNHWSKDGRWKFINLVHDFVTLLPLEYTQQVLSESYPLSLSEYEFFGQPEEEPLALLLQSFKGGKLNFSLDAYHHSTAQITDPVSLISRIRQAQAHGGYKIVLSYVVRFLKIPEYRAALSTVRRETAVALHSADWWWWDDFPLPGAGEAEYQHFLRVANRYRNINMVFRAGLSGYRLWPRLLQAASEKMWKFDIARI